MARFAGAGVSMWTAFLNEKSNAAHELLMGDDEAALAAYISDPDGPGMLYGIDGLGNPIAGTDLAMGTPEDVRGRMAAEWWKGLRLLAEAIGARKIWGPEQTRSPFSPSTEYDVENTLAQIEAVLGVPLRFPNPFPRETGLATTRGVVSERALHAIYQAYRLRELSKVYGNRILEIGAGLGRTAYFARTLGLTSYTIIDLPMTNVAQAVFLCQSLPERAVALSGEQPGTDAIRIEPTDLIRSEPERGYDIVLNADSMTEMDPAHAAEYVEFMRTRCRAFISINHEANPFTVGNMTGLHDRRRSRHSYSMRPGYAEEVFEFN